jgi:hypothetical protein
MKILRSIAAIVVGSIVSIVVIIAVEFIGGLLFKPADAPGLDDMGKLFKWLEKQQEDPRKMSEWIKTLPTEAHVLVLLGWQVSAFLGGLVSALVAGRGRCLHAGIIGGLVLAGTIMNFFNMKNQYDFTHPDWLIVLGLLLPLPVSLLAGKIVSLRSPPPLASNP